MVRPVRMVSASRASGHGPVRCPPVGRRGIRPRPPAMVRRRGLVPRSTTIRSGCTCSIPQAWAARRGEARLPRRRRLPINRSRPSLGFAPCCRNASVRPSGRDWRRERRRCCASSRRSRSSSATCSCGGSRIPRTSSDSYSQASSLRRCVDSCSRCCVAIRRLLQRWWTRIRPRSPPRSGASALEPASAWCRSMATGAGLGRSTCSFDLARHRLTARSALGWTGASSIAPVPPCRTEQ